MPGPRSVSGPGICEALRLPPCLSRPLRSKARDEAAWAATASANLQPPNWSLRARKDNHQGQQDQADHPDQTHTHSQAGLTHLAWLALLCCLRVVVAVVAVAVVEI